MSETISPNGFGERLYGEGGDVGKDRQSSLLANSICFIGFLISPLETAGQTLLSFADDFGKPVSLQRNPWEERIETERHDFTQSAVTVGRGVLQLESGYSYFYKDAHGEVENAHTVPEVLARVGISEDVEFRLRWNYAWRFIDEKEDLVGAQDLIYSVKLQVTRPEEPSWLPTTALELRGSAPTGGVDFSTGKVEFGLDYIYLWELGEGLTLTGSTGFATDGLGEFSLIPEEPTKDRFEILTQSVVLGLELTEANTVYAEWFGIYSDDLADEFVISFFNIGVDHYVTDNLVLDIRAGVGLTEDSDDFFGGVGGGYRF